MGLRSEARGSGVGKGDEPKFPCLVILLRKNRLKDVPGDHYCPVEAARCEIFPRKYCLPRRKWTFQIKTVQCRHPSPTPKEALAGACVRRKTPGAPARKRISPRTPACGVPTTPAGWADGEEGRVWTEGSPWGLCLWGGEERGQGGTRKGIRSDDEGCSPCTVVEIKRVKLRVLTALFIFPNPTFTLDLPLSPPLRPKSVPPLSTRRGGSLGFPNRIAPTAHGPPLACFSQP